MKLSINRKNHTPMFLQIKNQVKEMILNGELISGSILLSERVLSQKLNVHRNTITRAYQELKADGLINSTKGQHYSVAFDLFNCQTELLKKRPLISWDYLTNEDVKHLNDQLYVETSGPQGISFQGVIASPEVYPNEQIRGIFTEFINSRNIDIFEYCMPQGIYSLRCNIAEMLKERQIIASPNEIHLIMESNQILDYLTKILINPGDAVLVEEPVGPDVYRYFKFRGAKIITIPMDNDGMITDFLEKLILQYRPKLIYTFPTFHNPTGTVMSLERRYKLLDISYKYNIPIFEEDYLSNLQFEGASIPPVKALDKHKHVIYFDSFSMTFAPGMTFGYVVAPQQIVEKINCLASFSLIYVNSLNQYLMSAFIEKGYFEGNIKRLCSYYKEKRDVICEELDRFKDSGISYVKPAGGVCIWCKVPDNVNLHTLIVKSTKLGVNILPGYIFFPNGTKGDNYIRLSYSYPSTGEIKKGVSLLVQAMKESRE